MAFLYESSEALWFYRHSVRGPDVVLGYALQGPVQVAIAGHWYVRHNDRALPDSYFAEELVPEVARLRVPGLSVMSCRALAPRVLDSIASLRSLALIDLSNTRADDEVVAALSDCQALEVLLLAGSAITDRALDSLASFSSLRSLGLGWTDITDDGIERLAESETLERLVLRATSVSDRCIDAIAAMPRLRSLDLQETAISDEGVERLAALRPELEELHLGYTSVSDACVPALLELPKLTTLMLRATETTSAHDARLRAHLSRCQGSVRSATPPLGLIR
jgi:hypothetical protein